MAVPNRFLPNDPRSFARLILWACGGITCLWILLLAIQVMLRCLFPWDLYVWAESPFLTDMLKLEQGKPIYGPLADGNSFVYSPGLTYLTYAILKPFGLHLDIRFCRIVTVVIAVLASLIVGFALRRAVRMIFGESADKKEGSTVTTWLGAGIALLVIFKNFNADITHPDNLVMFHTAALLWLTLRSLQERSLKWALGTMIFAAVGVFAKQTLCVAFLGPALVFLRFKPWSGKTAWAVAFFGMIVSAIALAALWYPEHAKLYTWDVLTRQKLHLTRVYWMGVEFIHADRALLLVMAIGAAIYLWRTRDLSGRSYLQVWFALGIFSVAPGALAYVKHFGTWNNLIIHQLWLFLLVWPVLVIWFRRLKTTDSVSDANFTYATGVVLVLFLLALLPTRFPMGRQVYVACQEIQNRVTADITAGKRVLIAHGTMYQLRAGSREIPLDRANTIVDLGAAGLSDQVGTVTRIKNHYYDRLYLAVEDWYDPAMREAFRKYYQVDTIIPKPDVSDRIELGRSLVLIGDCIIMSPRRETASAPPER